MSSGRIMGRDWEEYAKCVANRESAMSDREHVEQNLGRHLRDETQNEAGQTDSLPRVLVSP
ncbi:hypothetical protein FA95DRAFT_1603253 [Auriscalpium vulgare]|uniref:Uncharacterized protein n=1 Tax=Auriscalpium vulgare TaxID=40419 RepID=A0ACB8S4R4_9AGAM|nr:hypothetical protein FA95DRAFT_1603253 [Auriscalpium vulgare]